MTSLRELFKAALRRWSRWQVDCQLLYHQYRLRYFPPKEKQWKEPSYDYVHPRFRIMALWPLYLLLAAGMLIAYALGYMQ